MKMRRKPPFVPSPVLGRQQGVVVMVLAILAAAYSVHRAEAIVWDGGGVNSEWIEPANWQGNNVPGVDDVATIINGTATITGVTVPPVLAVEVGLPGVPGSLSMQGLTSPAILQVATDVTVASGGDLRVSGGQAPSQLSASRVLTSGNVTLNPLGLVQLTDEFVQHNGVVTFDNSALIVPQVAVNGGLFDAVGAVGANVTIGDGGALGATLGIGSGIGELSIDGNLRLRTDASLAIQFASTTRGNVTDNLQVSGALTLGGTLDLSALAGATPDEGEVFEIYSASKVFGTFDNIVGSSIGEGSWIPQFGDFLSNGMLAYSQLRGNMNGDGVVDEKDAELFAYAIRDEDSYFFDYYLNGFVADAFMADMDLDGANTFADIPLFLQAVEASGSSSAAALSAITRVLTAVPEPSAWVLGSLTALAVVIVKAKRIPRCP